LTHTHWGRIGAAAATVLLATGCAVQAPRYQPSIDNVEVMKKVSPPVAIGAFTVQAGAPGASSISLRGNSMNSPVSPDYAAYLADALRQELVLAGKLDPKSKVEISGLLVKNDIAAGGVSTNSGEIEARFIVKNDGRQRFDKVKRAELNWESSFVGAIAIPKAQQQYPLIVQKLLSQLIVDADFQAALK
jgi:hypothetical protein